MRSDSKHLESKHLESRGAESKRPRLQSQNTQITGVQSPGVQSPSVQGSRVQTSRTEASRVQALRPCVHSLTFSRYVYLETFSGLFSHAIKSLLRGLLKTSFFISASRKFALAFQFTFIWSYVHVLNFLLRPVFLHCNSRDQPVV